MSPLITHFQQLARYNAQANDILYAACSELPDAERKRDRRAFFTSIHGALNHILVGDRIWMIRFDGGEAGSDALDKILYDDFNELRTMRSQEDARITRFMAGLDSGFLMRHVTYVNNAGLEIRDPVPLLLAHFFNHQTHHRGQVHQMLGEAGQEPPSLDMHRLLNPV